MPLRAATLTATLALVLHALGCASAPKEGFDGSVYRKGQVAFQGLLLALGHTPTGAKALLHRLSGWGDD